MKYMFIDGSLDLAIKFRQYDKSIPSDCAIVRACGGYWLMSWDEANLPEWEDEIVNDTLISLSVTINKTSKYCVGYYIHNKFIELFIDMDFEDAYFLCKCNDWQFKDHDVEILLWAC